MGDSTFLLPDHLPEIKDSKVQVAEKLTRIVYGLHEKGVVRFRFKDLLTGGLEGEIPEAYKAYWRKVRHKCSLWRDTCKRFGWLSRGHGRSGHYMEWKKSDLDVGHIIQQLSRPGVLRYRINSGKRSKVFDSAKADSDSRRKRWTNDAKRSLRELYKDHHNEFNTLKAFLQFARVQRFPNKSLQALSNATARYVSRKKRVRLPVHVDQNPSSGYKKGLQQTIAAIDSKMKDLSTKRLTLVAMLGEE